MAPKTTTLQHLAALLGRYPALLGIREDVLHATELICESCKSGGKLLVCGNGGSAADSEHKCDLTAPLSYSLSDLCC